MQARVGALGFFGLLLALSAAAAASVIGVSSPEVKVFADTDNFWAYFQTAAGQDLLYFNAANPPSFPGTSRFVFNLNGNPVDLQTAVAPSDIVQPVTASGSGLGATISMAKRQGNLTYGVVYTIVADPHLGTGAGYVKMAASITNNSTLSTASVGLRELLDIDLIDTNGDAAFLSTDNGATTYTANTLLEAASGPIPSDWWTYDQNPSPSLVARGVTWGNAFGAPATQPDAVEFCQWSDVEPEGQYDPDASPGALFSTYSPSDTAVVLWFTGTGQAQGNSTLLPPGQTITFVSYYGVSPQPLGATPTPYISFTRTPSFSVTPTSSFSVTPSITPTPSISPTFSASPTRSLTFTISPTFSPSPSITTTWTASPTFSPSPTVTPSPSITPTFSVSPLATTVPTASADLQLSPKSPNPNPSAGQGVWLPYVLNKAATVKIRVYTVSGELVCELDPFNAHAGANEEFWDQRNDLKVRVGSGVFIYRIDADDGKNEKVAFQKLAVVR